MEITFAIRSTGLLATFAALIYAVADSLLLASKADLADYPRLLPYAKLLSGAEKMVVLPKWRLLWGSLLGVFATPLLMAGFWQLYLGLAPAGLGAALPPVLLLACASIVGAFVHGSFFYLGEYVQALNRVEEGSQPVLVDMLARHRKVMVVTYSFLLACILVASGWYAVVVASGRSAFPGWMAAVNPVTALLVWMGLKRLLPRRVADVTEGAGFNIAYLIFFLATTLALWVWKG